MKAVIIGGGVAGMALAAQLIQKNWEVAVKERRAIHESNGLALLAKAEVIDFINALSPDSTRQMVSSRMNNFYLRDSQDKLILNSPIEEWCAVKRIDFVKYLSSLVPREIIEDKKEFSHFLYEDGKAIAAVFTDETIEYGDIFVGADGANSKVHQAMYGKVEYRNNDVNEVVCVVQSDRIDVPTGVFNKYQAEKGLNFGIIRLAGNEFVWFIQYSKAMYDELFNAKNGDLGAFSKAVMKDFPPAVRLAINESDFSNSYLWRTRDFKEVRPFFKGNVILIGDSAHLTLPFTSGGTSEAILDAKYLVECLSEHDTIPKAFQVFDDQRRATAIEINQLGTALKEQFLQGDYENFLLPLVD